MISDDRRVCSIGVLGVSGRSRAAVQGANGAVG